MNIAQHLYRILRLCTHDYHLFSSLSPLIPETVNPLLISINTAGSQEIGSTYTLQCIITLVNTPTIIWKNSTDIISNVSVGIEVGSLVNDGETWSVTLTFVPLRQSHDGEYVCIAYMNFDESDITNETVNVDVISESLYHHLRVYLFPIYLHSSSIYLSSSSIYVIYLSLFIYISLHYSPINYSSTYVYLYPLMSTCVCMYLQCSRQDFHIWWCHPRF